MGQTRQIRWTGQISGGLCLEQGLVKKCNGRCGNSPSPLGVRDSSSLMKLEDEACYVLLPVIHQAVTFSLSPLFSLPLPVVQWLQCGTNQANRFGFSFSFKLLQRFRCYRGEWFRGDVALQKLRQMEAVRAASEHPQFGQLYSLDGADNNKTSLVGH